MTLNDLAEVRRHAASRPLSDSWTFYRAQLC